jgi:hypothetical protein
MMNPNLYSYQYIDPIYYPMEMPTNGEPMSLPKVEMGLPMHDPYECHCCSGGGTEGLGLADLLSLLRPKRKKDSPPPRKKTTPIPKKETPKKEETPKKKEEEPIKPIGKKKDWWRIARGFVNIGKFYYIAKKYSEFSHTRNHQIQSAAQNQSNHQDSILNWLNYYMERFYNELRELPNMQMDYKNYDSKLTKEEKADETLVPFPVMLQYAIYVSGFPL